jgi:mono/diheme cytochrome c family protein
MLGKFLTFAIMLGLSISFMNTGTANSTEAKDGKTIFVDAKCTTCHSVDSQGVETRKKTDKTVDLSKLEGDHDAAFWMGYLKKNENLNNKKHPVAFKGDDSDLEIMINWLMSSAAETPAE